MKGSAEYGSKEEISISRGCSCDVMGDADQPKVRPAVQMDVSDVKLYR